MPTRRRRKQPATPPPDFRGVDRPPHPATARLYDLLVDADDDHGCGDLPDEACRELPGNVTRLVAA